MMETENGIEEDVVTDPGLGRWTGIGIHAVTTTWARMTMIDEAEGEIMVEAEIEGTGGDPAVAPGHVRRGTEEVPGPNHGRQEIGGDLDHNQIEPEGQKARRT